MFIRPPTRAPGLLLLGSVALVCACQHGGDETVDWRADAARQRREGTAEVAATGGGAPLGAPTLYAVTIHEPSSLTALASGIRDANDAGVGIGCGICHSLPDVIRGPQTNAAGAGGPHAGLVFRHGANACVSCHDPAEPTGLRLATGESVPMSEAIRLCAQCHGPQYRDYTRGSHGGMRGHWDLTRGPRQRNHCVDCHDAHAPAFPRFRPMPAPNDRFPPATPGAEHP